MTSDIVIGAMQAASTSTFNATTIVLIAAVVVSLLIGISSIVLTKKIESRKYKYELFKEMVDWLESVIKCGGEICLRFMQTKKITPSEEKSITEEAIAKYFLARAKADFIIEIADSAGFSSKSFKKIDGGITGVMTAIKTQLDATTINFSVLYNENIQPLNDNCSKLMSRIGKTLCREVKLKRGKGLMKNIKGLEGHKRLLLVAVGFAVFLSGISILTKDIPVPQAYGVGLGFIVFGFVIVFVFGK